MVEGYESRQRAQLMLSHAEEIRTVAERMKLARTRVAMLQMAALYEKLAARLEAHPVSE